MNQLVKKLLICLALCTITIVSGCSGTKADKNKTTTNENSKKEVVKMVPNDLYIEPLKPTNAQIKAFNELSDAISKNDKKEEATMVAVNYAFDFFTLKNKKDGNDIGGLQFISSDKLAQFMEFAYAYYYDNYPTIVNEYGKDSLPEVTGYQVESVEPAQFTYNKSPSDGYTVKLSLTYADTKVKELKKDLTMSIVQLQDFEYDRTKDYKKPVVYEGAMKERYRVLAVA